jgi:hypothetical protein
VNSAFAAIAAAEPHLKEGALRMLIRFAKDADAAGTIVISVRQIARRYGCSTSTVQSSIRELVGFGILRKLSGSRKVVNLYTLDLSQAETSQIESYGVAIAATPVLPVPVSFPATPPLQGVSVPATPTHLKPGLGVAANATPPLVEGVSFPATPQTEVVESRCASEGVAANATPNLLKTSNSRVTVDSNRVLSSSEILIVDRVLLGSIDEMKKLGSETIDEARTTLRNHARRWGPHQDPAPPDDKILAQFLQITDWPRLFTMLQSLHREEKAAGNSYAWYVTVGMQRIHGISYWKLQDRRDQLREQHRKPPTREDAHDLRKTLIDELSKSTRMCGV